MSVLSAPNSWGMTVGDALREVVICGHLRSRRIDPRLRRACVRAYGLGWSPESIAEAGQVHTTTVQLWVGIRRRGGDHMRRRHDPLVHQP